MFKFLVVALILSDAEWKTSLGEERYRVMRQKGTERAFSGTYLFANQPGMYSCAACTLPLFASEAKYRHPGSGWPTFKEAYNGKNVYYLADSMPGIQRYEVLCRGCDSHLGHVFHDGPLPRQLRYTINSIALEFRDH